MFIPCKINKQYSEQYLWKREVYPGLDIVVEKDKLVKRDTVLASGEAFEERVRIDISSLLEVKPADVKKYLQCLNGERVQKGDVLASKKGGVMAKDKSIIAPKGGVVNLSLVESGILRILGEARESTLSAGVDGKVKSIIQQKFIIISTDVLRVRASSTYGRTVQGELFYLSELDTENLEPNFTGGIIAIDFKIQLSVLRELALLGVRGIIVGGMDSDVLSVVDEDGLWGMTVCVTEGFGNIQIHRSLQTLFAYNDGRLILLDPKVDELILTKGSKKYLPEKQLLCRELKVGDSVQIFESEYFGLCGVVEAIMEEIIKVKTARWGQERLVTVNKDNIVILE